MILGGRSSTQMHRACRSVGRLAIATAIAPIVLGALAGTAGAQVDPGDLSAPELIVLRELIGSLGPMGVVAYLAYVIGRAGGLPVTVQIRLSEAELEALRSTARLTVIHRTKEPPDDPGHKGGRHG